VTPIPEHVMMMFRSKYTPFDLKGWTAAQHRITSKDLERKWRNERKRHFQPS
jgi:hypothetical protein